MMAAGMEFLFHTHAGMAHHTPPHNMAYSTLVPERIVGTRVLPLLELVPAPGQEPEPGQEEAA